MGGGFNVGSSRSESFQLFKLVLVGNNVDKEFYPLVGVGVVFMCYMKVAEVLFAIARVF
jgi:hypothetical protein